MSDNDPNYIEAEVTVPTRVQYMMVRLRAGRRVRPPPETVPVEDFTSWLQGERARTWDALADELAEQGARQAERVATRVQRDSKTNGDAPKRY